MRCAVVLSGTKATTDGPGTGDECMTGTGVHSGVNGLTTARMQTDGRRLQMIAIVIAGTDRIKRVIHLGSAELRLIRADQYLSGISLADEIAFCGTACINDLDAFAESGAVREPAGQTEWHISAQCGGNGTQAFHWPV